MSSTESILHFPVHYFFSFVRACVGLKPQNHMLLEHKHSREVNHQLENGPKSDMRTHLENGFKFSGSINGEIKEKRHPYINGDSNCYSQVKQII